MNANSIECSVIREHDTILCLIRVLASFYKMSPRFNNCGSICSPNSLKAKPDLSSEVVCSTV